MTALRRVAGHFGRCATAAARAYTSHLGPQLSAALAYHVLLSLFPLLIFLVAILGLVLSDEQVKDTVINWLLDTLPLADSAKADIENAVEGIASPSSAAGLVSIAALIWAASGAMAAVRTGLDLVWEPGPSHRRPAGRAKILDLLLVLIAGAFVLISVGLSIVIQVMLDRTDLGAFESVVSVAGELTRLALPFAFTFATFVLLYARVPAARPPIRTVWLGALLAALVFEGLKIGFTFYLTNFARYNIIYGSLGAAVAFLVFAYLSGSVFFLGADFAAAWPATREPSPPSAETPEPLTHRARRLVRGLFFRHHDASPGAPDDPQH
jgi:membrane protein